LDIARAGLFCSSDTDADTGGAVNMHSAWNLVLLTVIVCDV